MGLVKNLLFAILATSSFVIPAIGHNIRGKPKDLIRPYKRAPLQDIVTWDEHSLFINGERVMIYSGEFHPYRLPVPSLWLDVFQKIRALGYTGVSFYVDWALLEGKAGNFSAEGVFDFDPFFEAASTAGIYLIARPGPYINAEASGGGYPGWLQRITGKLRTPAPDYLNATQNYVKSIGEIIAKAQITNGGPVILLQPENEYTQAVAGVTFPDATYMSFVEDQYRNASIVVPLISNDAAPDGHNAPGQPAAVDIYGHDGYPLGFDCANPSTWPNGVLPTNWRQLHLQQSPTTPFSLAEFQGGSFDPWGGLGFEMCASLLNSEFERVFYKNDYSFGVTIFNIYMTFGGTNWGNLGHPGGYTSYDYGAVLTEDRLATREKYSQAKLQANFIIATPAYLTATPGTLSTTLYTNTTDLSVTPLVSNQTQLLVLRHSTYNSLASTSYTLKINGTSAGTLTIPQLGGSLTLNGRDSKVHVSDYDLGGINLLYSTAEIFTWQSYSSKTVLVVYGGPNERHELAVSLDSFASTPAITTPSGITTKTINGAAVFHWQTTTEDQVIQIGDLFIYVTDRNSAYNYWVLPIPGASGSLFTKTEASNAVIKGGYLLRTATVSGDTFALTGDLNLTTSLQIIGGAPDTLTTLTFNGEDVTFQQDANGVVTASLPLVVPEFGLPQLNTSTWFSIDSLPEIQPGYSDAEWTDADNPTTNDPIRNLTTPTSLYAGDYGFHTGAILYRGHFTAAGNETTLSLLTQGGSAFGISVWLNGTFLGSFAGFDAASSSTNTFTLPNLVAGQNYVITVVVDTMGLDENFTVGSDEMKDPRGILDFTLTGRDKSVISWKITGNLGGEDFVDRTRGPLNEGGMWAERQGFHLPNPPVNSTGWTQSGGPTQGTTTAGIEWYVTSFDLDMPAGYDIPIAIQFTNTSTVPTGTGTGSISTPYRVQVYVNGWQFAKYVHNIGPQTRFPVPEGIWNYHGENWLAVSLWSLDASGSKVENLQLVAGPTIQTGRTPVQLVDSPSWTLRPGAF